MTGYAAFAGRLQDTGVLGDPWVDGKPRFREAAVVLDEDRHRELCAAAEGIAAVHDELMHIVAAEPALLDAFFGLTPWQRSMWECAAPDWHGIARADVFWTPDGAKVCELNSDTPSGEAEAVLVNAVASTGAIPGLHDPNASLADHFVAVVEAWAATVDRVGALSIGIVYPTEFTEDLSMIAVYRDWLQRRGHTVVLGSPFNLGTAADGRATLFATPCDVVVRHYKTDWFGERLASFDDEPPAADRTPLVAPLLHLLTANVERRTAIVNPFGTVLTQNKRCMAFCWEEIARFSRPSQAAIERWLPRTLRLEFARDELWHQRERFVLKSDYGCEGDEVIVGPFVDAATWESALAHAIARRFVAQEYFEVVPDAHGDRVNHGVYVLGGRARGVLARVHTGATDATARIAPVFVRPSAGEVRS